MLRNYKEINENETVESFLKEVDDKKNSHYIILECGENFVDFRTIALKVKDTNEKLKNLKKPLSKSLGENLSEHLNHMIESGERVIKIKDELFDFLNALDYISKEYEEILNEPISSVNRKEVFALNENDTIANAKNILLTKNINLLPVIKGLEIIGEIRTFDLLANNLYSSKGFSRSDYYNEKHDSSILNLTIDNLMNNKPHTISKNKKLKDAVDLMINKKLPSLIVTDNENLHSIVSYKDIFKLVKNISNGPKYILEFVGNSNIYEDEFKTIEKYAEKSMDKISKMSNYDNMKISFKSLGNMEGTHQRKIEIRILISHGNKVLTVDKQVLGGTSDEISNNKVKGNWNIPQIAQEALKIIEKKVIDDKKKRKK